jgi:ABC-type Zn2+ transport system substrate-binding protein/surface adhesin
MTLIWLSPQKFVPAMLLLIAENLNVWNWPDLYWHKVHTTFHEKSVNQFKRHRRGSRHTHTHTHTHTHRHTHTHTHSTDFP